MKTYQSQVSILLGIPDNVMKTLIVDIKFNDRYFERVLHHEVFHIINDSFKDIFMTNKFGLVLILKSLIMQNVQHVQKK